MEVLYAWERLKPIYVVAAPGTKISPWLRYHATQILESWKKALEILLNQNT